METTTQLEALNFNVIYNYEKLFKFAEKTGLVKNGKYIDGIPQGKVEYIEKFSFELIKGKGQTYGNTSTEI